MEKLTRDGKYPSCEKEEEARKEGERERGEEEMKRERKEEREEREGREEDFPPPVSSRNESNFRHKETLGERRGKSMGEMEEEFSSSFPLRARMPGCRRRGRKMGKRGASREREKRERECGREGEKVSWEREEDSERERLRERKKREKEGERRGRAGERDGESSSHDRNFSRERGYGREIL